jgi:hypothetical protein
MPDTMLGAFSLVHLVVNGRYYELHFTDTETEAQGKQLSKMVKCGARWQNISDFKLIHHA